MRTRRFVAAALLVAAWGARWADAEEDRRAGFMRAMRARLATRQARDTAAELGKAIPAVREELDRHRQAMMDVLIAHLGLVNEIDKALRELREAGAQEAELEGAAKKLAPQANELAAKRVAALATHYANLAKILNPADEAKRKEVVKQLAEGIIKRMATEPEERARPAFGFPGGMRRFPGGFEPGGRRRGGREPGGGRAGDRGEF